MLTITVPGVETFNEVTQEFITTKDTTLCLEHSLVSLSKWESKWHKPYMTDKPKTSEETIDYIKCMTITKNVNPEVYSCLTKANIDAIEAYIRDPMTATTFVDKKGGKGSNEGITSELIYYWMVSLNIPVEFQKWHINRLLTLIRVCNIKNDPGKKMSKRETASKYAQLNAARRKKLNTKG